MALKHLISVVMALLILGCDETNYYLEQESSTPAPNTPIPIFGPTLLRYDFESVIGSSIPDLSENKIDLAVDGCRLANGPVGYALSCDESGSASVAFKNSNLPKHLSDGNTISVQFWMKIDNVSVVEGTIFALGYTFVQIQSGKLVFRPNYRIEQVLDFPIMNDTWYNVAITFSGAETKFYINGELQQSFDSIAPLRTYDNGFEIFPNYWEGKIKGSIDNLRILDEVSTEEDVLAAYQEDL